MATVAEHPTLRRWLRLLAEVDSLPDAPPALMGIHDEPELDEDVVVEFAHRTRRRPS